MGTMQIKRGTTESWNLGPELVNFEELSIRNKDSVVRCDKNTITIKVGSPSMNIPYKSESNTKINGIPIITSTEGSKLFPLGDTTKTVIAIAKRSDGSDISGMNWGISIYGGDEWADESNPLIGNENNFRNSVDLSFAVDSPEFFVWWHSELCETPTDIEITLSIRDKYAGNVLAPGQLGCELDDDGNTLLKVGPHNALNNPSRWNNIPYVGQVLPACMYGTSEDRKKHNLNLLPRKGQIYFLESQTTPGAYYITIYNGSQWSDEIAST